MTFQQPSVVITKNNDDVFKQKEMLIVFREACYSSIGVHTSACLPYLPSKSATKCWPFTATSTYSTTAIFAAQK
jgi:hypothetical protein